jgi:hypothetical protein
LNGGWKVLAGGCNMNRDIPNLISDSGFKITDMTSMYLPSTPRVLGFNYWGHAKKN